MTELADGRAPSRKRLEPRLIRPEDCGYEIRGGGNATRQIVDILPPAAAADRLLICEVFTPGGNWSSYPPHKHDVDRPPGEVKLEEIYYYRFAARDGFGVQRLYDERHDRALTVSHGDVVADPLGLPSVCERPRLRRVLSQCAGRDAAIDGRVGRPPPCRLSTVAGARSAVAAGGAAVGPVTGHRAHSPRGGDPGHTRPREHATFSAGDRTCRRQTGDGKCGGLQRNG